MLAALLLLGILPLAAMPFMEGAKVADGDPGEGAPEEPEAPDARTGIDDMLGDDDAGGDGPDGDDGPDGEVYRLGAEAGEAVLPGFEPGVDMVEVDLSTIAGDIYYDTVETPEGSAIGLSVGEDEVLTLRFPDLAQLPAGDISLSLTDDETGEVYTVLLSDALDELQALDPLGYFAQPVDDEAIPEYRTVIPDPMDFSTMRVRLRRGEYSSPLQLADDFVLLCRNALVFNPSATNPYRVAAKSLHGRGQAVLQAQFGLHLDHHLTAALLDHRQIAGELDHVTETLLVMHQHRLALEFGPVPARLVEFPGRAAVEQPAAFVTFEPLLQATHLKQCQRPVPLAVDVILVKRQRLVEAAQRGIGLTQIAQDEAEVVVSFRRARREPHRLLMRRHRHLEPAQLAERIAHVGIDAGIVGFQHKRAAITRHRRFELSQRTQRDTHIVVNVRLFRVEQQRLAVSVDRILELAFTVQAGGNIEHAHRLALAERDALVFRQRTPDFELFGIHRMRFRLNRFRGFLFARTKDRLGALFLRRGTGLRGLFRHAGCPPLDTRPRILQGVLPDRKRAKRPCARACAYLRWILVKLWRVRSPVGGRSPPCRRRPRSDAP